MDTNLVFFDDFNATSNTSSGENHRSLINVLFFFLNYHKGTFLADTIFFDTHYQTIDNRNIVGVLPILFSICEIDRSKGHTGQIVDIQQDLNNVDEDDYELVIDIDDTQTFNLFYHFLKPSNDAPVKPHLNQLKVLPDNLIDSTKHHELLNYILALIENKIWTDSDVFTYEYKNRFLYCVFIYLSKTIDLSFNSSHDSFTSWLELRNLSWFGANEVDTSDFATLELYIHALSYTLKLANHIVKAIINNNVTPFKVAPQEELFYFFAERTDARSPNEETTPPYTPAEDDETFSTEHSSAPVPAPSNKETPKVTDAYLLVGADLEDSESTTPEKNVITQDFNYQARLNELYELSKSIKDEIIDAPIISINQAWNIVQDKWKFYLDTFSSSYFNMNDFEKTAILKQLKSLKASIFMNWFDIKSGAGQQVFIDLVSYDTFKIEFLSSEAKMIQTYMKDRIKNQMYFETTAPQPKFLRNLKNLFNERVHTQKIKDIENTELLLKVNGILDGVTKDLIDNINLHLSNDIYLVNYFSNVDKELEPPKYHLLDILLRTSVLNLIYVCPTASLNATKDLLNAITDPEIEVSAFDTFDRKQYQNQIVKELACSFRQRIDPSELLKLDIT